MEFIEDLKGYKTRCDRVLGFIKLQKAGLRTPFIKIVNHQAFLIYKKKGITKPLQQELEAVFFEIKKENPKRDIYVGRAYYVPHFPNPPGPRFVVGNPKSLVLRVADHFDFVIQSKYDARQGAQIGVILHPWINPRIPLGGGCVTLAENGPKKIVIEAIYGLDEGIQSFPHDFYLVDFGKDKIIEKIIAEKKECLEVDPKLRVTTVSVPQKYWQKQVLEDRIILSIAQDFRRFIKKYGPHRLEYAFEKEGVYYRECIPFALSQEKAPKVREEGKVFRLNTRSDLPKINKEKKIIFVDPIVIKRRQMNLLTFLATQTQDKKIILYPGSATTGHAATIFRETGHLVVFVGSEFFRDKDKVVVETKNGELVAQRL